MAGADGGVLMAGERVVHILHLPEDVRAEDVEYIGRRNNRYRLPGSKWANRYGVIKGVRTATQACKEYEAWFWAQEQWWLRGQLPELRGKALACWCVWPDPEAPCHGKVLVEALKTLCE